MSLSCSSSYSYKPQLRFSYSYSVNPKTQQIKQFQQDRMAEEFGLMANVEVRYHLLSNYTQGQRSVDFCSLGPCSSGKNRYCYARNRRPADLCSLRPCNSQSPYPYTRKSRGYPLRSKAEASSAVFQVFNGGNYMNVVLPNIISNINSFENDI